MVQARGTHLRLVGCGKHSHSHSLLQHCAARVQPVLQRMTRKQPSSVKTIFIKFKNIQPSRLSGGGGGGGGGMGARGNRGRTLRTTSRINPLHVVTLRHAVLRDSQRRLLSAIADSGNCGNWQLPASQSAIAGQDLEGTIRGCIRGGDTWG